MNATKIQHDEPVLSASHVSLLADRLTRDRDSQTVLLDLQGASKTDTAALAMLIRLRARMLQRGQDLRLTGLTDRAHSLWERCRLGRALPKMEEGA